MKFARKPVSCGVFASAPSARRTITAKATSSGFSICNWAASPSERVIS